ncbi:MAG: zinc-binding dehydrogenase [Chloroflexi bacterium]|nr:zinc-binding dehydrogenase [Chloroflexota bacterium]
MLAVHFLGQDRISLDDVPRPEPRGREVLVRVRSAAICGTDRENLEGPGQATIPGHENAGEVVAVDRPARIKVGDRVAINCHVTCGGCEHCLRGDLYFCDELQVIGFDRDGGYAEFVLVPEACCMPLPDDISFAAGSLLVDMLGTSFRAVKRARLLPGDRVAIWGAGPIGLGALMVASWFGARVAILDMNEVRLRMARELGAALVLDPAGDDVRQALRAWTQGRGLDVAFDCVGNEAVAHQALDAVKKRGTFVVVGVSHKLTLNPWEHLICRELAIFGTRNFNTAEFEEMIALVRRGLPLEQVVTHRFPLAEAEAAFALFRSAECGKILLTG